MQSRKRHTVRGGGSYTRSCVCLCCGCTALLETSHMMMDWLKFSVAMGTTCTTKETTKGPLNSTRTPFVTWSHLTSLGRWVGHHEGGRGRVSCAGAGREGYASQVGSTYAAGSHFVHVNPLVHETWSRCRHNLK